MRAIVVEKPGDLRWQEIPDVVAGAGEVVVDVVTAGINRADLLQAAGNYPPPPGASEILGLEVSGRISELGADVEGWSVGQEVCALLAGGGYAERVAVPAPQLMPVPEGVGVDVILDIMGASYLDRNVDALAPDGRLVVIGFQGGVKGELNLGKLLGKRAGVIATALRSRPVTGPSGKGAIIAEVVANVWPMIAAGKVRPVVGAELPITEAAEAHRLLESSEVTGKVLLRVAD